MSSSPAMLYSMVDLPQPLGPSRMMNSPSRISRLALFTAVTLPKRLVRFLSVTLAMFLSFDATGGEAAHDVALHTERNNDRQDVGHHAARHEQAKVDRVAARELRERHRQRLGGVGVGKDEREEELVPGVEERKDGCGSEAGRRQRQHHTQEGAEA